MIGGALGGTDQSDIAEIDHHLAPPFHVDTHLVGEFGFRRRAMQFPGEFAGGRFELLMTAAQIAFWDGAIARLVKSDEWKKDLEANVFENTYMNSEATKRYLKSEYDQFHAALTAVGLAK